MIACRPRYLFLCWKCDTKPFWSGKLASTPAIANRFLLTKGFYSGRAHLQSSQSQDTPHIEDGSDATETSVPIIKTALRQPKKFRQSLAVLESQSLGKPAEVIILQDEADKSAKNDAEGDQDYIVPRVGDDSIKERIGQESTATQEEVNEQLDKLRPRDRKSGSYLSVIPEARYVSLVRLLLRGFTFEQLQQYGKDRPPEPPPESQKEPDLSSAWTQWKVPINKQLKQPRRAKRAAHEVIATSWQIQTQELLSVAGSLHRPVNDQFYKLLTSGRPSRMDTIGRNRVVKIEGFDRHHQSERASSLVRITGPKANAVLAAKDIDILLESMSRSIIVERKLGLMPWRGQSVISRQDVMDIEATTGASILNVPNRTEGREYRIIAESTTALKEAKRCLEHYALTLIRDSAKAKKIEVTVPTPDQMCLLHWPSTDQNLPLPLRGSRFGRWTIPALRSTHTSSPKVDDETPFLPKTRTLKGITQHLSSRTFWTHGAGKEDANDSFAFNGSKGCKDVHLSASFGHILHRFGDETDTLKSAEDITVNPADSVFAPLTSNLTQLLPHLKTQEKGLVLSKTLIFRLVPGVIENGISVFPEVILKFQVHDDEEAPNRVKFLGMHAVCNENIHDIMLPSLATDIRFKASKIARANETEVFADEKVAAYIGDITNIILSGDKLSAPPTVPIKLTRGILLKTKLDVKQKRKLKYTKWCIGYQFVGVEHHETLTFADEIMCTIVEAGRLGGRYQEISISALAELEGNPKSANYASTLKSEIKERLLGRAFRLANLIDRAAKGTLGKPAPDLRPKEMGHSSKLPQETQEEVAEAESDDAFASSSNA